MSAMKVTAVVAAHNEEDSVCLVLRQLWRAGVNACVLVANGCTDGTVAQAKPVLATFETATVASVPVPLGPDVGRAVGAFTALRSDPDSDWLVFVDADWQGGFGPALEVFIRTGVEDNRKVLFVGQSDIERLDQRLWHDALCEASVDLCGLEPNLLPLLLHTSVFRTLSPRWLAHPGVWAVLCLQHLSQDSVGVFKDWNPRIVGNRQRGWGHDHAMRDLLLGDAVEGISLLCGQRSTRVWKGQLLDGGHKLRRFDLLDCWAGMAPTETTSSAVREVVLPYDLV